MVYTVVNALSDRLLEELPPNRSYSASRLSEGNLPGVLSDYLKYEMLERLREAVPEPESDSWIDVRNQDVRRARASYIETLAAQQRIPSDEWPSILKRACDETVRFLVRPSSTLCDVIFADVEGAVEPSIIFPHLDRFTAYPYFRDVIEAYLEQKSIARIDRQRLEGLINRIDRQMTIDYGPAEWSQLLRPLLEVLSAAGYENDIPVDLLTAFLQEKGADGPLSRLKEDYGSEGFIPATELSDLFREEANVSANGSRRRTERVQTEAPAREEQRGPVPLWKQFEQGSTPSADEPVAETSTRSVEDSSEPLWKQFRKVPGNAGSDADSSSTAESPLADLERSVLGSRGARNRDLFVRHLFSGSRAEYETTLRKLQRVGSWSEASKVIAQEVFLKHQVNIYSDPAVAFTDAAESKYRS